MRDPEDPYGGAADPWTGVIHKPCPSCGAEPEQRCTFDTERLGPSGPVTVRVQRHMPCIRRICDSP